MTGGVSEWTRWLPAPCFLPFAAIGLRACNRRGSDARDRIDRTCRRRWPRHARAPWHFECTRLITPAQVSTTLKRIPGLVERADGPALPQTANKAKKALS
jgi:hypothetical protein